MTSLKIIHTSSFPTLAYRKVGEGPAVVLLHGFPQDGEIWVDAWAALMMEFTVLMPDLPGSGGSVWDADDISIEQMAESVKRVLEHEGIEKAVVAGHSMGGYTAAAFADLYPQMLAGLSFINSLASADSAEKKETRQKSIDLIRKGGKEPFIKQMTPNLFSEGFKTQHPEVIKQQIEKGLQMKPENMIAFYNAMMKRPDRIHILSGIKCPVQWVTGKEDNIANPETVLKQSKLANANFVSVYSNCGHMSMLESPDLLIKDVSDFARYCHSQLH